MTDNADPEPGAKPGTRPPRRITVGAVVRAAGSTAALVAICYLLLLTRMAAWAAVTMLAAGLVAFIAMVAFRSAGWPGRLTADRQLPRVGWLHPKRMTCGYDPAGILALIGQTA
jgi:hypothetical protein